MRGLSCMRVREGAGGRAHGGCWVRAEDGWRMAEGWARVGGVGALRADVRACS